ncbi:Predicted protein [Taphrina deformans PYCC 5710]|uniref:Uncharacterized protein n=1 Tax=Taphrina deformans (strain PYCC 5710 / ATCC 11124 / CBS 356.35 / IMI 108563 / JCM 9778 / NBRC 8474) TaxID=1097556 RepID=R4XD34_TAPDE|nr:Predicted protein [Taphrina deformans PYCC 5710]|eukprot:CCG82318.1 Predicted protein [Taphrina deformans PYCC 5710]
MARIILFGYPTSPYFQKIILVLNFLRLPYSTCAQPRMLPRPDLASLGITYRRIPIASIDGHVYADTSLIIARLCGEAGVSNDNVTEAMGAALFPYCAMLIPYELIADPAFLRDRSALTGRPWTEESVVRQRGFALAQFRGYLATLTGLLEVGGGTVRRGGRVTMADLHLAFVVQWVLFGHRGTGQDVSPDSHPVIYAWLKRVQSAVATQQKPGKVSFADVREELVRPSKRALEHDERDPSQLKVGAKVAVTPTDTGKSHPQVGELLAINDSEVCLKTSGGVTISFPRINYVVGPVSQIRAVRMQVA